MNPGSDSSKKQVGIIYSIPVELIRPDATQPRKFFDEKKLQELAASIAANGQETPIWLVEIDDPEDRAHPYEIVAGERRWKSHIIAGKTHINAEIRVYRSTEARYLAAVAENFGRENCNALETLRSVQRTIAILFGDGPLKYGDKVNEIVGGHFTKNANWVAQYRRLLALHPEVQEMMGPEATDGKPLSFQIAYALTRLTQPLQLKTARTILKGDLSHKQALALIAKATGGPTQAQRKRKPYSNFRILARFIRHLGEDTENLLSMKQGEFEDMFRSRSDGDLRKVIKIIRARQSDLGLLLQILEAIAASRTVRKE